MNEEDIFLTKIDLLRSGVDHIFNGNHAMEAEAEITNDGLKISSNKFSDLKNYLEDLKTKYEGGKQRKNADTKVIFVGSISTGKSKIVNAIIKRDIMLSSASHTTRSFIKIFKSKNRSYSVKFPESKMMRYKNELDIKKVLKEYTQEYVEGNVTLDEEVEIGLPSSNNTFITDNVFLYDTPGYGGEEVVGNMIFNKCKSADIIVFVMANNISMESTALFEKLKEFTFAVPTFVLINKWDATDNEDDVDFVKDKIKSYIEERISGVKNGRHHFFISGKEAMQYRSSFPTLFQNSLFKRFKDFICKSISNVKLERENEFEDFQSQLEQAIECAPIDKSKRYKEHYEEIQSILNRLKIQFDSERINIKNILEIFLDKYQDMFDDLVKIENDIKRNMDQINSKIKTLKSDLMRNPNRNLYLDKLNELNKEFDDINGRCDRSFIKYTEFIPAKRIIVEKSCAPIKVFRRKIINLNIYAEKKWAKGYGLVAGAAAAGAVGAGAAALGAATAVVAAPLVLAAGLGFWAYKCLSKKEETETVTEIQIDVIEEVLETYSTDLIEGYGIIRVAITKSKIRKDCETWIFRIRELLKQIDQDENRINDFFC